MNTTTNETVTANASMAIDQRSEHSSLQDALDSYWENILDTVTLRGGDRDTVYSAYVSEVRRIAAKLGVSLAGTDYAGEVSF